jgi:hypothetical protein
MRRVLLLLAIAAAGLCRPALAQGTSGYIGVSATVLPAPATASVGGELAMRETARGLQVSAPVHRGGAGPAMISVERQGDSAQCEVEGASDGAAAGPEATAGRVTCSVPRDEARRDGGADVPVSILIVPAT